MHVCSCLVLVFGVLAVSAAPAQQTSESAGGQRKTLLTAADLVPLDAPPPDRRISYGEGALQFGHLRLPAGAGPHPVVVFVHGGCWLSRYTIGHVGPFEVGLVEAGYAVWSLEYRRVGDDGGGWPGSFLDVGAGADHLRRLAADVAIDLDRVVVAGHSAGAQLALWLAARGRLPRQSELYVPDPLVVRGVLALAPAPDLEGLHAAGVCGRVVDRLMEGSPQEHPERYAAASPVRLAPIGVPQTVVVGGRDWSWGPGGLAYVEVARAAGDRDLRLVELAESGHFEMIVPTTSSWPRVLSALDDLFGRLGAP